MRVNLSSESLIRAGERQPLTYLGVVSMARVRQEDGRELDDKLAATIAFYWRGSDPAFHALAYGEPVRYGDLRDAITSLYLRAVRIGDACPLTSADERVCLDMLGTWALNGADGQEV